MISADTIPRMLDPGRPRSQGFTGDSRLACERPVVPNSFDDTPGRARPTDGRVPHRSPTGSEAVRVDRPSPHAADEVSAGWLAESMRSAGLLGPGGQVDSVTFEVLGEGAGLMGVVARYTPVYSGSDSGPASVIGKFSTTDPANRAIAASIDLYGREVRFYRHLATEMQGRCPRCYRSDLQDDGQASMLLLEDFPNHHVGDQVQGASLPDAEACVTEVARLHATFWGGRRPDRGADPYHEGQGTLIRSMTSSLWPELIARYGALLPSSLLGVQEDYIEGLEAFQTWLGTDGPCTVTHGDLRLDNVLFGEARDPDPVVLIDFQAPQWAKGVHDLSYFLTQSLEVDVRRAHEERLLRRYFRELARHGIQYDVRRCWEDYRRAALVNLGVAITISCAVSPPNDRARELMRCTIVRATTAFDDLRLDRLLRPGVV